MAVTNPPVFIQTGGETAEQARRYTDAHLERAGIATALDLAVSQNGTPNMSVNVASGRALILGTESTFQGVYKVENRSTLNLAVAASDPTNPRKDLVVAKVQDAAYSGAVNAWSLVVVTGTPAPSPAEPAVPANALVLAMVSVAALATTVVNANITDRRTTQAGQEGLATSAGGVVICISTARPAHKEGRVIYETDTDRVLTSDGTNWTLPKNVAGGQLGYAEVASDQTTITTEVDLTSLSVAVTVLANRRIKVIGEAQLAGNTANMRGFLRAKESTTTLGIAIVSIAVNSANAYATARVETPTLTPSAGSHTYKLSLEGSGGTVRANSGTTFKGWIRVEDIGGV